MSYNHNVIYWTAKITAIALSLWLLRYMLCRPLFRLNWSLCVNKSLGISRCKTTIMASSGAAEKPKYHEGRLKPYPHEELGRPGDVRWGRSVVCRVIVVSVLFSYSHVSFSLSLFFWFLVDWKSQRSCQVSISSRTTGQGTSSCVRNRSSLA